MTPCNIAQNERKLTNKFLFATHNCLNTRSNKNYPYLQDTSISSGFINLLAQIKLCDNILKVDLDLTCQCPLITVISNKGLIMAAILWVTSPMPTFFKYSSKFSDSAEFPTNFSAIFSSSNIDGFSMISFYQIKSFRIKLTNCADFELRTNFWFLASIWKSAISQQRF